MTTMLTLINFMKTQALIGSFLKPTPLIYSHHFSKQLNCDLWFKPEILQPTGTFKVRGAFSKLLRIPSQQRHKGVVTGSAGNHGMAVAYAANKLGIHAQIYMPRKAPSFRVRNARKLGATVLLRGNVLDDVIKLAKEHAENDGSVFVHPFVDPEVQLGQGTMGLEVFNQLPSLDAIVASMGGGGLIAGLGSIFKALKPAVQVWGVETQGADCINQSVKAGHVVALSSITSIAESLGALTTDPSTFETIQKNVDNVATVSDKEAVRSLVELLTNQKLLVEPACSCTLAALQHGKLGDLSGKHVVVVLSGGSVEASHLRRWLL